MNKQGQLFHKKKNSVKYPLRKWHNILVQRWAKYNPNAGSNHMKFQQHPRKF